MNRLTHNKYELSIFQKKEIPIKELKEFNYNLLTGIKSDKTLSDYFMYLMDFLRNPKKFQNNPSLFSKSLCYFEQ